MKYKGKILKTSVSSQGYVRVLLQNKDYKINYSVHRRTQKEIIFYGEKKKDNKR